jgi:YD repeat-containing protein
LIADQNVSAPAEPRHFSVGFVLLSAVGLVGAHDRDDVRLKRILDTLKIIAEKRPANGEGGTVRNVQGQIASVTDALSHPTSYVYDAFNDLTKVTDPAGNVTTNTYDLRGHKIATNDPDMGSWSYAYDALGELTSQTDAKGQTVTDEKLGPNEVRLEWEGEPTFNQRDAQMNRSLMRSWTSLGRPIRDASPGISGPYIDLERSWLVEFGWVQLRQGDAVYWINGRAETPRN